jgi:uncharacterized membrane protein (UPF0127 family)
MSSFLTPILRAPEVPNTLVNVRTGDIVATQVMTAFDSTSRRKGLLEHRSMPPGAALIIAPCNGVHTFGMRFAIDLLFVARDGTVVKVCHAVPRRRIAASWRAFATIELAAGALDQAPTQVGDIVEFRPGT